MALAEAADLLHATPSALSAHGVSGDQVQESARSLRHKRLDEARGHQSVEAVETGEVVTGNDGTEDGEIELESKQNEEGVEVDEVEHESKEDSEKQMQAVVQDEVHERSMSTKILSAGLDTATMWAGPPRREVEAHESSSVSTSEDSDSEFDSDSDSGSVSDSEKTSDTVTDEEDSEEEEERLEKLLQGARVTALAKETATATDDNTRREQDEIVLSFERPAEEPRKEAYVTAPVKVDWICAHESLDSPIPDIAIPALPRPHLSFDKSGRAHAQANAPEAGPSRQREVVKAPELDDRPYDRELTKKEKATACHASVSANPR